jgi:hypothetical protein
MKPQTKILYHVIPLALLVIFQMISPAPVHAAGMVGGGVGPCDEAAFDAALAGGGTITFECGGPTTITLTGTKVISADTQIDGGGLITLSGGNVVRLFTVDSPATLSLSNITIANGFVNNANGGAVLLNTGATLSIADSTFSGNRTVGGYGGAIYVAGGTLDIVDSLFINNNADVQSIGIYSLGGGAIQNNDGTVTISGSTFTGNSVTSEDADGGAIYNGDFDGSPGQETPDAIPDVLTVINSTFYNNFLVNNLSGSSAGAIRSSSNLTIIHSTFSNNDSGITVSGGEAGAVTITHGTAVLTNNIFANSTAADCATRSTVTSVTSTGNLIETNYGGGLGCGTPAKTADPMLGPLQNNGGPTPTMALNGQSPAVNVLSACPVGTDQRGISRPQPANDKCDIGAYELVDPPATVSNVYSTTLNGTYGTGGMILIKILFNDTVTVTGLPQLTLETGTIDRTVDYFSGSGSNMLTFVYTVQAGDTSGDLDYVSTTALSLNGGTIQDSSGKAANLNLPNPGAPGSLAANNAIIIDTTQPTLTSFTRQNPATSSTNANSLVFRATFSEAVMNVNAADFTASGGTTATIPTVTALNQYTYDITVSNGDLAGFNGDVGLDLKPGQNITDLLGNTLPTTEPATDEVYAVDNTQPSVDTIVRAGSNSTNAPEVSFTVTFTESITAVDAADFALTTTGGVSGASVTGITGTGATYTVKVNSGSGNGTIRLDVPVSASVMDLAGNWLGSLPFTGGEVYSILKTPTFNDVARDHWAWKYVEGLYDAGVTSGCSSSPMLYCPTATVTRDQMAIFLLRGKHTSSYTPPKATGVFSDVPTDFWAADWIEQLALEGITSGCSTNPKQYCPTTPVTRDQMAVFLLRAKHGSDYVPPKATGVFQDVPVDYWAADWIEQLAVEEVTLGCSVTPKLYCPTTPVSRDQMAVFLVRNFGLATP